MQRKMYRKRTSRLPWLLIFAGLAFIWIWTDGLSWLEDHTQKKRIDTTPVSGLDPAVLRAKNELVQQVRAKGIHMMITEGFRSPAEQDKLYNQGRTTAGKVVTQARGGESYHNYGLAIDFAIRTPDGGVVWDMKYDGNGNGIPDWSEIVTAAKALGFTWGGDWADFPDYPHLQMDFGLSIRDLQRGRRPPHME
ncbi:M15 family metallopeptidase [Paenibacillus sp. JX-17]|uniref:M15 family metallopeptidase n=1 Tax=Paenibacillus lacisoli TaxID=3064525 RepID=A0ABT9CEQ6_9BACL|nr:M15 family metallopeptidase [Paenibacillus sp. JX-17]MDO7907119.1 M15 family metallopeptidase [Paenibacillus sp. JX-17]